MPGFFEILSKFVAATDFFTAVRESGMVYPVVLATHLTCIAVFGGAILMTNLRLLGLAMPSVSITEIIAKTRILKRTGFALIVGCGAVLAGAKLNKYYDNTWFQIKLILLCLVGVHALAFRQRVYNRTGEFDRTGSVPAVAKTAACLSLILWFSILSMGRMIAYYERPGEFQRPENGAAVQLPPLP